MENTILRKSIKYVGLTTVLAIISAFIAVPAYGNSCYDNYGREIECPIEEVSFSLSKIANKEKIAADETVTFTIAVKNTGTATVDGVTVIDTLPSVLEYVSGDVSNVFNNFKPGEERTFTVKAMPVEGILPDGGSINAINEVDLTYKSTKLHAEAVVIIQNGKILAASTLPETSSGYEIIGLISGLSITFGAAIKMLVDKKIVL